jgi:predicted porin
MKTLLAAVLSFALLGAPVYAQTAQTTAQTSTEAQLQALQAQLDALKAQIEAIKAQQMQQQQAPPPAAKPAEQYVRMKPGKTMTFLFGKKDEVTLYGHVDVSADDVTKGLANFYPAVGAGPIGNHSWMNDISSNSTYFGIRGSHKLGGDSSVVYQVETGIAFSSSAGTVNSNSTSDSVVNGALTTRPTYLGLQTDSGRFLVGKTYSPYRNSTARMNPFAGEIGDYAVVMGNTGGDNRVEFGGLLDHAVWYESPNWGGFTTNLLVSPGQNRSSDDSLIAAGESDCTGQQSPGAGALPPFCNDGSFGSAYSYDLQYQRGPLYFTAAYELHKKVNRVSDLANLDPNDVADEDAFKTGLQYAFSHATTFSAIYEDFHRYVPSYLEYQNERQRTGFWFALTQWLAAKDNINFGWARANPTPGDPGQHNTPATANPNNMSNMFTAAWKHNFDEHFGWYLAYADTVNHPAAHYDLGAGGHGVTTDCHDASIEGAFDATVNPPVSGDGPHCWAGGHLQGISTGITLNF